MRNSLGEPDVTGCLPRTLRPSSAWNKCRRCFPWSMGHAAGMSNVSDKLGRLTRRGEHSQTGNAILSFCLRWPGSLSHMSADAIWQIRATVPLRDMSLADGDFCRRLLYDPANARRQGFPHHPSSIADARPPCRPAASPAQSSTVFLVG